MVIHHPKIHLFCLFRGKNINFINSVTEALRMLKEIRHPDFKLIFDCGSASAEETSVNEALIRALDSRALFHIYINDKNGREPGFGKIKFTSILKTLVKDGYKGFISVKVFKFSPDPQTIASRSIGYLKGILETSPSNFQRFIFSSNFSKTTFTKFS